MKNTPIRRALKLAYYDLIKTGRATEISQYEIDRTISNIIIKLAEDSSFEKAVEGKRFTNPETGNKVKFQSLPTKEQSKIRAQYDSKNKENTEKEDAQVASILHDDKKRESHVKEAVGGLNNPSFKEKFTKGLKNFVNAKDFSNFSKAMKSKDKAAMKKALPGMVKGVAKVVGVIAATALLGIGGAKLVGILAPKITGAVTASLPAIQKGIEAITPSTETIQKGKDIVNTISEKGSEAVKHIKESQTFKDIGNDIGKGVDYLEGKANEALNHIPTLDDIKKGIKDSPEKIKQFYHDRYTPEKIVKYLGMKEGKPLTEEIELPKHSVISDFFRVKSYVGLAGGLYGAMKKMNDGGGSQQQKPTQQNKKAKAKDDFDMDNVIEEVYGLVMKEIELLKDKDHFKMMMGEETKEKKNTKKSSLLYSQY